MVDVQTIGVLVTAASVSVAAIYYILTLRNTVDNRKAQLLMEYNKMISSKEWLIDLHESLNYEWKDFNEFWLKYGHPNPEAHSQWISIGNSMSCALLLLKYNLVNEEMLREYLGYVSMGSWWEKFGPAIKEIRVMWNLPDMFGNIEFYYNKWRK
jgi:hypothetical protein